MDKVSSDSSVALYSQESQRTNPGSALFVYRHPTYRLDIQLYSCIQVDTAAATNSYSLEQ